MPVLTKMRELKTDESLLTALKTTNKKLSAEEVRQQRVSFVYGSMKSDNSLTKEQLKQAMVDQETA